MTGGTQNAIIWLLKIAATLMLVVVVALDLLLLIAWIGLSILEGESSRFPLWIIIAASLFSFVQFLISSFLYGVSKQVATGSGADLADATFGARVSDTIDDGWFSSLLVGKISLVSICALLLILTGVFFNDLKFMIGLHRGMELTRGSDPAAAQKWFAMARDAGGNERAEMSRFMYAGSLIRSHEFGSAEDELKQTLDHLDPNNEDHQALRVYVLSGLSNCYLYQNKLDEAEKYANASINVIEKNPHMLGLSVRVLGPYKQFLIPEPPPLEIALSGLNDIYARQNRTDLASKTFDRIIAALEKRADLRVVEICVELNRFNEQMSLVRQSDKRSVENLETEAKAKAVALSMRKCNVKDEAEFDAKFAKYLNWVHSKYFSANENPPN